MFDTGLLEPSCPLTPTPLCISVCTPYAFRYLQKPEKRPGSPGAGVIGDCESPAVGAGGSELWSCTTGV